MVFVNTSKAEEISTSNDISKKKRILILISEGGGGHKAAGEALKEILGEAYDVEIRNAIIETELDGISRFTRGICTSEDLYNFFLRRGLHRALKIFAKMGLRYMVIRKRRMQCIFENFLNEIGSKAPDLIISTVPMINGGLVVAAYNKNIPFLIMPTDLDTDTFLSGMEDIDHDANTKFVFALPYDDPDLYLKAVLESNLKSKHLEVTGFPVRRACQKRYTPEEIHLLKKKHGMAEGDWHTITLIVGAVGGDVIIKYAKEIVALKSRELSFPIEINVCVGRNQKVGRKIIHWCLQKGGKLIKKEQNFTSLLTKENVLLHIRGFTRDVIEVMACSELIITKTGSCSVNEAIYLGKKLLLDNTKYSSARHIWWEGFNVSFVKKHGLGDAFNDLEELKIKTLDLLIKNNTASSSQREFTLPNFEENIINLVSKMIFSGASPSSKNGEFLLL
jgi:UDP-N-acetylglucosamine:LPS N-acetylglucosamine transferase